MTLELQTSLTMVLIAAIGLWMGNHVFDAIQLEVDVRKYLLKLVLFGIVDKQIEFQAALFANFKHLVDECPLSLVLGNSPLMNGRIIFPLCRHWFYNL